MGGRDGIRTRNSGRVQGGDRTRTPLTGHQHLKLARLPDSGTRTLMTASRPSRRGSLCHWYALLLCCRTFPASATRTRLRRPRLREHAPVVRQAPAGPIRAPNRHRTDDLSLTRGTLCHLSYRGIWPPGRACLQDPGVSRCSATELPSRGYLSGRDSNPRTRLAAVPGIEPRTSGTRRQRSA